MRRTADDLTLNEHDFHALTSRGTGRCVTSRSTANDDQFLLRVHVLEVTGKVVVELDVVVVASLKSGTVVVGTATVLGQYRDG